jgi:sRNA-binding protein
LAQKGVGVEGLDRWSLKTAAADMERRRKRRKRKRKRKRRSKRKRRRRRRRKRRRKRKRKRSSTKLYLKASPKEKRLAVEMASIGGGQARCMWRSGNHAISGMVRERP